MNDPVYKAKWYRKNKSRHLANVRKNNQKYKKRAREIILAAKDKPCHDCKKTYGHWIMQFDHRQEEYKDFDVSTAPDRKMSAKRILAEIAKCDVVCANCHCERTYQRRQKRP